MRLATHKREERRSSRLLKISQSNPGRPPWSSTAGPIWREVYQHRFAFLATNVVGSQTGTRMTEAGSINRIICSSDTIEVPEQPGKDTYSSMVAAERGDIATAIFLGGNLYGSNPDTAWAGRAINAIDTVVHINTKLNTGLVNGRGKTAIILPALVRDEELHWTTQESMFNYVRVSEGGASPTQGPDNEMRSEVDIIASLAERMLPDGRFDWAELRSHVALRVKRWPRH